MSIGSTTPPDVERLKVLIAEAYDALPGPDQWELKELEERLSRQLVGVQQARKPSTWAWWLVGVLLAGSAAAWWTYDSLRNDAGTPQPAPVIPSAAPATPPNVKDEGVKDERAIEQPRDGDLSSHAVSPPQSRAPRRDPVIYQREGR